MLFMESSIIDELTGNCKAPASKPDTQRAIIMAALAHGVSRVQNPLYCLETKAMLEVCSAMGADITEHEDCLIIRGVAGKLHSISRVLQCAGSGLVYRIFCALASLSHSPVVLSGDKILQQRIMQPLYTTLTQLGARIEKILPDQEAPIVNWGGGLRGGICEIPANISSQFITALLIAAPLAENKVILHLKGNVVAPSYILQTIDMMRKANITVYYDESLSTIEVEPGQYQAFHTSLYGDYTAASYLFAAATLLSSEITIHNLDPNSRQGEKKIIEVLCALGLTLTFQGNSVTVKNHRLPLTGQFHVDVTDCPNILPTLAVIGSYVQGSFTVTGGHITQLHKSPRIEAMMVELRKLGVNIQPIYKNTALDGFIIEGKSQYPGGVTLRSWNDHRIFMSLFIASLKTVATNTLELAEVSCSFPTFFTELNNLCAGQLKPLAKKDCITATQTLWT